MILTVNQIKEFIRELDKSNEEHLRYDQLEYHEGYHHALVDVLIFIRKHTKQTLED